MSRNEQESDDLLAGVSFDFRTGRGHGLRDRGLPRTPPIAETCAYTYIGEGHGISWQLATAELSAIRRSPVATVDCGYPGAAHASEIWPRAVVLSCPAQGSRPVLEI